MHLLIDLLLMLFVTIYVMLCGFLTLVLLAMFIEGIDSGIAGLRRLLIPAVEIPTFRRWCGDLKWTLIDLPFRDVEHLLCNGDPSRCTRRGAHSFHNRLWWLTEMDRRGKCQCNACH